MCLRRTLCLYYLSDSLQGHCTALLTAVISLQFHRWSEGRLGRRGSLEAGQQKPTLSEHRRKLWQTCHPRCWSVLPSWGCLKDIWFEDPNPHTLKAFGLNTFPVSLFSELSPSNVGSPAQHVFKLAALGFGENPLTWEDRGWVRAGGGLQKNREQACPSRERSPVSSPWSFLLWAVITGSCVCVEVSGQWLLLLFYHVSSILCLDWEAARWLNCSSVGFAFST